VIVHDPALNDDPGLVAAAGAGARLAIQNARLHADVKAQLEEVRASRLRLVQAGEAERRRVERNLHDGAQQPLLAVSLALGIARRRAQSGADPDLIAMIDQAAKELSAALEGTSGAGPGCAPSRPVPIRSQALPALAGGAQHRGGRDRNGACGTPLPGG
jgi:GAF domain-containing protein